MYANGWGVPEDNVRAFAWIILAASQGNEAANRTKAWLSPKMSPDQVSEAQKIADDLSNRIATDNSE
jgi:TPR repeat protein